MYEPSSYRTFGERHHVLLVLSAARCVQVSLVATAPLTNLALAVKLKPNLPQKLKALYIMGGNTECT